MAHYATDTLQVFDTPDSAHEVLLPALTEHTSNEGQKQYIIHTWVLRWSVLGELGKQCRKGLVAVFSRVTWRILNK